MSLSIMCTFTHNITRKIARSLAVALAFVAVGGCARSASATRAPAASASAATDGEGYSVYDLDTRWRDQNGNTRQLSSLRGRPQVVAMIYTHCSTTCPFTVAEMKQIERESPGDVGFLLVSLDPTRDDPARLAMFAAERGLDASRWTLLDGSDDEVRELATVLGVRYRHISPDELAHSNALTLLSADGDVVYQHAGLDAADEVLHALDALARRAPGERDGR